MQTTDRRAPGGLTQAATVHVMSEGKPTDFPAQQWTASLRRHNVRLSLRLVPLTGRGACHCCHTFVRGVPLMWD